MTILLFNNENLVLSFKVCTFCSICIVQSKLHLCLILCLFKKCSLSIYDVSNRNITEGRNKIAAFLLTRKEKKKKKLLRLCNGSPRIVNMKIIRCPSLTSENSHRSMRICNSSYVQLVKDVPRC